jgi:hypothetical protein
MLNDEIWTKKKKKKGQENPKEIKIIHIKGLNWKKNHWTKEKKGSNFFLLYDKKYKN